MPPGNEKRHPKENHMPMWSFGHSDPELKARRRKAFEAAAWGIGRGTAVAAMPGLVIQAPAYVMNDLWMFKAIYECYFDESPSGAALKELVAKYLTATGMAVISIS